MPFLEVDPKKFGYLVSFGTREGELQRFFKERYRQLILRGAKLRHLPSNRKDRINCLVNKLPRSTDDIVRDYFQQHITLEFPEPVPEILEWFTVFNDNGGGGLPADDARRLARSALVHLFAVAPDQQLIAYLRDSPASGGREVPTDVQDAGLDDDQVDSGEFPATMPDAASLVARLPMLLAAATFGQTEALQNAAGDLPKKTQAFIDGLLSARAGDGDALESAIDALETDTHERSILEGLRSRARAETRRASAEASGLRVVTPALFDGQQLGELKVIGVATKELDAVVFVKPLAIDVNGVWMRLTDTDRVTLFPISGDTMTHRGSGKRIPQVGEYVHWLVEHRERGEGRTRFHVSEELTRLYEVVELDSASGEPDDVRIEIARRWRRRRSPQPVLFALTDGLVVSPRTADLSRDDAYDQPWWAWTGGVALALDGRLLAFDPPKDAPGQIDLAPLELVAKRLIRSLVDEGKLSLTRKHISELSELLRSQDFGLTHARVARVLRQLEAINLDREAVDALLPRAISRPEVQARVDEFVDSEVRRRLEARDGLLAELEAAKSLKRQLQTDIKTLDKRKQLLKAETEATVVRTFERAIGNSLETLAGVAIFNELSGRDGRSATGRATTSRASQQRLLVRPVPQTLDADSALRALRDLGIGQLARSAAIVAANAAMVAGLALVVRGSKARFVARTLSCIGQGTALTVEIPLGFTNVVEFWSTLTEHSSVSSLCILNADSSAIEQYAGPVLDLIASRFLGEPDSDPTPFVLFAVSEEEVPSRLLSQFAGFGIQLDLEQAEAGEAGMELEDAELTWPPIARRRLRTFSVDLGPDEQKALNAVLRANVLP